MPHRQVYNVVIESFIGKMVAEAISLDYLENLGLTEKELEEKLEELQKKGIGIGIIIALRLYGVLNLQSIADLIGSKANKTLYQVKKLVDEGYIEKAKGEWGKNYALTKLSEAIFAHASAKQQSDSTREVFEKFKEMTLDQILLDTANKLQNEKYKEITTQIKMVSNMNKYIEQIAINEIGDLIKKVSKIKKENQDEKISKSEMEVKLIDTLKESNFTLGTFDLQTITIPLTNKDQMIRIVEFFYNFRVELGKLRDELVEENKKKENLDKEVTNQYIYSFLAPVKRSVFQSKE